MKFKTPSAETVNVPTSVSGGFVTLVLGWIAQKSNVPGTTCSTTKGACPPNCGKEARFTPLAETIWS